MIVRDEEQRLPDCLDSVAGLCAERIVVDTGSRDGTVACARARGARVVEFAWCDDFAAARNAGIREATSDWVLVLDADERLAPGGAAHLARSLEDARAPCGMLTLHDAASLDASAVEVLSGASRIGESMPLPRLFRRTPDLAFEGIVHESVRAWLVRHGGTTFDTGASIVHYGAVPALRAARGKQDRNTRLLEKRLELEPDDFTVHGYLAHELIAMGDRERAFAVTDEGWRLVRGATRETLRSAGRLLAARCLLLFQRGDADEVLRTVADAVAYEGETPDALFFRARAHEQRALRPGPSRADELAAADLAYRACLRWARLTGSQRFVIGATGHLGRTRLATVELLRGDAEAALAGFEDVLSDKPKDVEAGLGACEALVDLARSEEASTRLEPFLGVTAVPDAPLIAAIVAESRGRIDALARHLADARARREVGYVAPHRNALHVSLHCAMTAYLGRPQGGPGAVGAVCAHLAGQAASVEPDVRDTRALERFVGALLTNGHVALVERLLSPAAEQAVSGIGAVVERVAHALATKVEGRR
jgi:tetratricopeptide (TPR) repeat protein